MLDTGAAESVAPATISAIPTTASRGSIEGQTFTSADGGIIDNEGEKVITMHPEHADRAYKARFQIASITRPLMSVAQMCDQYKEVLFTRIGAYVLDEASRECETWVPREGNLYLMDTWVSDEAPFGRQG